MPLGRTTAVALVGVEGALVDVEAHLAPGLPAFVLVGLPDTALSEARDRVRAAVANSGERWPGVRITVGLAPASLPKRGSGFDLAIATAVLLAAGDPDRTALDPALLERTVLLAELGLDGRLHPVRGVLPAVAAAARSGVTRVVCAEGNAAEAALVPGVSVRGLRSLRQVTALLRHEPLPEEPDPPVRAGGGEPAPAGPPPDLADVLGQHQARHALEVAAAGGHALHLTGPPGTGKTMLAERLPGLLPELSTEQALEVTALHSLAGILDPDVPLVTRPPFQAPHHSASTAAVVGGGSGVPRPGAVSLAHRGVLFLDEAPEFAAPVLDALRQPLESGRVVLARAAGTARYPARCTLVLASNPCPCGLATGRALECTCSSLARRRYAARLSGPLLDRVDLRVDVVPPLGALDVGESTAAVGARVTAARERSAGRLAGTPWRTNAEVPGRELRARWRVADDRLVRSAVESGALSLRGADRALRVSWTLADLAGRDRPSGDDVALALALRLAGTSGRAA
ncbi:magnesium chelatase family protein [Motilibacter rhizosphaerae]|uniref:Magnesium chelatase family protein n=1 Tax=Motilibacter rhizosphaerae TaxID=598652 RepID=A0A4Q7NQV1_9ACTN|nr:YifB family Mg chelatase-like AAA ATPase [Motilibacter rhizosphaerae]RZS86980.1 magnesium chelatase family protein [Motilibacter rhizosphaerae]